MELGSEQMPTASCEPSVKGAHGLWDGVKDTEGSCEVDWESDIDDVAEGIKPEEDVTDGERDDEEVTEALRLIEELAVCDVVADARWEVVVDAVGDANCEADVLNDTVGPILLDPL